jgi:hypothetical protein
MKVDQKIEDLIGTENTGANAAGIVEKILSMAKEENTSAKSWQS